MPGRNVVVCLDGTSNQFGAHNSNVVKLYSVLKKDPARQITYYDPGVGTLGDKRLVTPLSKKISKLFGLPFGYGFTDNIADAYGFLMNNYREEDRLFLFGFSRGSLAVRALAGMLHACGLLNSGNENMIPYTFLQYKGSFPNKDKELEEVDGKDLASRFKATYSRACIPYFIGLWDTVTSIGWSFSRKTLPHTASNPDPVTLRHALAIDERRGYYPQNVWREAKGQDVKQVWFAGAHSDVGGSYPEAKSGLSKIALEWILAEAAEKGLLLEAAKCGVVVHGGATADGESFAGPDFKAELHRSLHGGWWILEYLPMNRTTQHFKFSLHRGRPRDIKPGALIHRSVLDRMAHFGDGYRPPNLPADRRIEEYKLLDCSAIQPDGDATSAVRLVPPPVD